MNVTFHVLTGIAVAACLSPRQPSVKITSVIAGFGTTVALHGLLDHLPHSYPIKSTIDVALGLLLFGAAFLFAKPHLRPVLAACFLGCTFPDLLDFAPSILNHNLGLSLPVHKNFFPWHWKQYSGSIYDGSRKTESWLSHITAVAVALSLLWHRRDLWEQTPSNSGAVLPDKDTLHPPSPKAR